MNYLKATGFGFMLFAILFVVGSIAMFGLKLSGTAAEVTMFAALVILTWILAKQYRIGSLGTGIQVGVVWMIVYALLDYIVIVRIFNPQMASSYYISWTLYLYYLLIVVVTAVYGGLKRA